MQNNYLTSMVDEHAEELYRSPMYKEIRLNDVNGVSRRNLKANLDHISESNESWTLADSEKSYQSQLAPLTKEKFYDFLKTKVSSVRRKAVFEEIRKSITFKIDELPDEIKIQGCFEKVYLKCQNSSRQAKKNWTEEETTLLVYIVTIHCVANEDDFTGIVNNSLKLNNTNAFFEKSDETWFYFSSMFPGKKTDQIKHRWQSMLRVTLSKAPWTKLEDEILTEIMKVKTEKKPWRDVASELNHKSGSEVLRNGKQCRERWSNHLDPSINRGAWTDEEDMNLLKVFLQYGKKWSEIAGVISNRNENAIKNRFNSLMRKYQKDSSLGDLNHNKESEEDVIWERRIASLVLSSNGYSSNNGTNQELETKLESFSNINSSPEHVYVENDLEQIKQVDPDALQLSKPSHKRQPSRIDQKKNLLKSIVQHEPTPSFKHEPTPSFKHEPTPSFKHEPTPSFKPTIQQNAFEEHGTTNISNGPLQNFQSYQQIHSLGSNPSLMANQFTNNFGFYGNSYQPQQQQQQQQYTFQQPPFQQPSFQQPQFQQPQFQHQGMQNYYGGFNALQNNQGQGFMDMNMMSMQNQKNNSLIQNPQNDRFGSNQFMQGSSFNHFSNPHAGGSNFAGQRPIVNEAGQPLNSQNILSSNTINFPMSSPSTLRTSNNPFLTAPTFPLDGNPFKIPLSKSNSFSDDSKEIKDSSLLLPEHHFGMHVETPMNTQNARPVAEIKREFIEKSLNEFNPENMIKPNSNKLMFAIVDYEKNLVYPINPLTFENYKTVMAAAKSSLGRDSLFASPLSLGSDFASPHLRGNVMEFNNITKLNNDFASLAIQKHQNNKAQQSPSLKYLNSLITGKRMNDSPDSFSSLRSSTLLGGSLSRRPIQGQINPFGSD